MSEKPAYILVDVDIHNLEIYEGYKQQVVPIVKAFGGEYIARGGALDVALSKDGRYALLGQENYNAVFIETSTGSILSKLAHSGDVNTVAISSNGKVGVTGSEDGHVRIWDLLNQKEIHSLTSTLEYQIRVQVFLFIFGKKFHL